MGLGFFDCSFAVLAFGNRILPSGLPKPNKSSNPPLPLAALGERLIGLGGVAFFGGIGFADSGCIWVVDFSGTVALVCVVVGVDVVVLVAFGIRILPSGFPKQKRSSNPPLPLAALGERLIDDSGDGISTTGLCCGLDGG